MLVYRYIKEKYLNDPLSAIGANRYGGRWNSPGKPMLYTSLNASTAQLEILAGINNPEVLSEYHLVCLELPDDYMILEPEELIRVQENRNSKVSWDASLHPEYTREIGDLWMEEQETLTLLVPSSLCQIDYNALINTKHPRFSEVKVLDKVVCPISPRLFS